jgi:hypothetical protein
MIEPPHQSIVIHFADGSIESGVLRSSLLTGTTLRYLPQDPVDPRRRVPRVPFLNEVRVDHLGVRRGVDLSTRGMYVETLTPYNRGALLHVTLRFGQESIDATAKAVFIDPGIGMGVEFQGLSAAARHKLEALVQLALSHSDSALPLVRRANEPGRRAPAPTRTPSPRWDARKRDRRESSRPSTPTPIEVELSRLKSIFFVDRISGPDFGGRGPHPIEKQVVVAFRDGEEIHGTLHEISHESPGFFLDLHLSDRISHTVYVVKHAVKSIQTVL